MDVYESMANFRKTFGLNPTRSIHKDYYKWKILNNPYCLGHIELELIENLVTGSASITPKKIAVLGEILLAAEIGDTFTHPEYRRMGIFSRVVKKCTEYANSVGVQIIYGKPNDQSLPGYQWKLGYPPCEHVTVKHMYKYLCASPLENKIKRRFGWDCPAKVISYAHFYFLSVISFIRKKHNMFESLPIEILPIMRFEKKLDGLWGAKREEYAFFTIRDEVYFNWRFLSNPDDYIVLAAMANTEIVGCIVLKISGNGDFRTGSICDFITYQDRMDVFIHLLRAAELLFRQAGVCSIELVCSSNSPYYESIRHFGYFIKSNRPIIVFLGTDIGKQLHASNKKWHFTIADSDNI